jgi:hypothetical protein
MATTTTTNLDSAMKIIFDDALVNNVVRDTELVDAFQEGGGIKTDQTTGGRYIETAQMFSLPAGVGARSEGDYIPVPQGPVIENSRINLKKVMGAVEMTAETMKMVRTNEGAFVNWSKRALPALVERVTHELDRMLLGTSSGILARVNATTPATDLVVDTAMGVTLNTVAHPDPVLQFLPGAQLRASPNADGSTPRALVMIVEDLDYDNDTITVDQLATGLADDDYIFMGDANTLSAGKEPQGIHGLVDDGTLVATFQNIVRANYSAWRSLCYNAQDFGTNVEFTEDLIQFVDDKVWIEGGGKPNLIIAPRFGCRQFWQDLKADRAINDPRNYTGGKGYLYMVLGDRLVQIRSCRKMPRNVAFGITTSTMKKFMLHNWEWDDTTGSIWKQVVDGTGRKDAFWAYGSLYCEFGCSDPQKNFRIQNLYVS